MDKISVIINELNFVTAYSKCFHCKNNESGEDNFHHSLFLTDEQKDLGYRLLMVDEKEISQDCELADCYYDEYELKFKFSEKKKELELISIIRDERNKAFAIGDKYQMPFLFSTLTEEQKEEYKQWRQDWLDATKTKSMPEFPNWMN